jgi:hypothetical protein
MASLSKAKPGKFKIGVYNCSALPAESSEMLLRLIADQNVLENELRRKE